MEWLKAWTEKQLAGKQVTFRLHTDKGTIDEGTGKLQVTARPDGSLERVVIRCENDLLGEGIFYPLKSPRTKTQPLPPSMGADYHVSDT